MQLSAHDLLDRLEQLNQVGISLSKERDLNSLLEKILYAAKSLTGADGGTLYRMAEDGKTLRFEIVETDSLGLRMGGTSGVPVTLPDLPLHLPDGAPNDSLVAAYAAIHQVTVNVKDVYNEPNFDFSGTRHFDARTGYRSQSFLTVPLINHEDEVIGVLQLINARSGADGVVVPFSAADQSLTESLASQAAIAWNNRLLFSQMEALFESFITVINLAIDEKSPHTGAHCLRVPELTMMLAEAVHRTQGGPLVNFTMTDQDRYELKIAGMLHDCGKVTTPVHVVDKSTKLQTIYDRIGLIDTRIEVLKRDEEILALRRQLALRVATDEPAEREVLADGRKRIDALDATRHFLRSLNRGSEAVAADDLERVRNLAGAYRWRNPDGVYSEFLSPDEVENLTIRAGTLTAAEREVINHHIVATINMLNRLPWPKHLKNVPEYAGGHHERMDGLGYPKGLTRKEMSVQARIMGIADIFEALTARDRPYKVGFKLSEAMAILYKFKANGHIDPDLFDVFVEARVYQQYAERFLEPWQIDEVNPEDWTRAAR